MTMTTDITDELHVYRELARSIWNIGFCSGGQTVCSWDDNERFEAMALDLFEALISERHDLCHRTLAGVLVRESLRFLSIVPTPGTEILVGRDDGDTTRWGNPFTRSAPRQLETRFLELWDWERLRPRDLAFYLVEITGSSTHARLVGSKALIPVSPEVRVIVREA